MKMERDVAREQVALFSLSISARNILLTGRALFDPLLHFYKRLHWPAAGDPPGRSFISVPYDCL